ncbi:MAG: PfkB family carbohydrate kinase [Mariprofundus sp.]|nr:PfkB family carbohydrate kinase [Mariprofundus sp.]
MLDVLCIGHASYDITMAASHHPEANEKILADAMQLNGGGPAANASVCVARLGGKAGFCGYLSNDLFGTAHCHEFETEGVDTSLIVRGNHPSPLSQILAKPDGARSVVNFKADTPWLNADAVKISQTPKVILFDGHEPLISMRLCQWAETNSIPTVLDAGSLHQGTRNLAGAVDYLVASEQFARQFSGSDDMHAAMKMMEETSSCVVITMGEKGLIWSKGGDTGGMDAFTVDVIDSTGSGDAFHGAFAYGLSLGMNWQALLRYASAAAALTCTKLGAQIALPDTSQVYRLLHKPLA